MSERKPCVLVADDSPEVRRGLCRYMVAWEQDDGETIRVLARRVWGDGRMDGSGFELATDEWTPDVAYAGGAGMFLVTTTDGDEVYGRRYAIPVADFAGSPLTGTAPLTVTFSNADEYIRSSLPLTYTTAYTWTFGDGATSTLTNPVHSFTQTGSYTVTLTTAVVTETDALTRTSYITVSAGGCISPTAGFSGSPHSACGYAMESICKPGQ
jgi:hypothetical protein